MAFAALRDVGWRFGGGLLNPVCVVFFVFVFLCQWLFRFTDFVAFGGLVCYVYLLLCCWLWHSMWGLVLLNIEGHSQFVDTSSLFMAAYCFCRVPHVERDPCGKRYVYQLGPSILYAC